MNVRFTTVWLDHEQPVGNIQAEMKTSRLLQFQCSQ